MVDVEKERINNYVKDMDAEESQNLVRSLDSELMFNELMRRDRLNRTKLSAIELIMRAE